MKKKNRKCTRKRKISRVNASSRVLSVNFVFSNSCLIFFFSIFFFIFCISSFNFLFSNFLFYDLLRGLQRLEEGPFAAKISFCEK